MSKVAVGLVLAAAHQLEAPARSEKVAVPPFTGCQNDSSISSVRSVA
jgi:hypothetical protein